MPYPIEHRKLTISGKLWGGVETFSFGFRTAAPATQPTQAQVDAIEAPLRTWFTSPSLYVASVHEVSEIKLAPIGTDGRYPPGLDSVVKVPSPAMNGGGSGGSTWPQCSYAVSLTTGVPRGRAHIGRFYLPPFRAPLITSNGSMAAADVDGILAVTKTFLNALNALPGVGPLIVASKLGVGTFATVTGLRGGLVMDTQRRRRRSIPETPRFLTL